jgi:hypothetical protein
MHASVRSDTDAGNDRGDACSRGWGHERMESEAAVTRAAVGSMPQRAVQSFHNSKKRGQQVKVENTG